MRTFLVESYLPASRASELDDAIVRLSTAAPGARYVRSTYVPEDEICFHVFEAESIDAVREAGERAALAFDRIVEARVGSRPPADPERRGEPS
jgi:hypothetical protein